MLLVIFSESLGAAETFAAKHGYEIDPDQELIALGVANVGSGLHRRTGRRRQPLAVGRQRGRRRALGGLAARRRGPDRGHGAVPHAAVQEPARGGARGADHLRRLAPVEDRRSSGATTAERRVEFWLGLATLAGVITLDVLPGLLIGVVAMLLLFIYQASRPHVACSAGSPAWRAPTATSSATPSTSRCPVCSSCDSRRRSSTPTRRAVRDRIKKLVGASDPLPRAVILDAGVNDRLDITSAEMLEHWSPIFARPGSTSRSPTCAARHRAGSARRTARPSAARTGLPYRRRGGPGARRRHTGLSPRNSGGRAAGRSSQARAAHRERRR